MINSVTVTNHLGKSLRLELARPEESGLAITSISGLGPGKATINTTELATNDGTIYNSARVNERNIVIGVQYMFHPTIEQARHIAYEMFPLKKKVTLEFETEMRHVKIDGYVETVDPDIFSKEVKDSISILCPDPFFYSMGDQTTYFTSTEPLFEFPFSNEGLVDTDVQVLPSEELYPSENLYPAELTLEATIEFGSISFDTVKSIVYTGEVEAGMTMTVRFFDSVTNIVIFNLDTREQFTIHDDVVEALTGDGFMAGDVLTIVTGTGQKSMTLLRNGETINIINAVDRYSDWILLHQGDNAIAYTFTGDVSALEFEISNKVLFGGI